MKNIGISRKIDHLGRIVIPMELRHAFDIHEQDEMQIYVEGGRIILEPVKNGCVICGEVKPEDRQLLTVSGYKMCMSCAAEARAALLKYDMEGGKSE